jgi:hypothetical protein
VPFAKKSSVAPPPVETKENFFSIFISDIRATVSPPPIILSAFDMFVCVATNFSISFVAPPPPASYLPSGPFHSMSFDFLIKLPKFFHLY